MKWLSVLPILFVGFIAASAQEIPEELFDNNSANSEITASLDKFWYKPGGLAQIFGYVHEARFGNAVFIQVIDPNGNLRSQIKVSTTDEGIFNVQNNLPEEMPAGTYTLSVKQGSNGVPVSLSFKIKIESNVALVKIPPGAELMDTKKTFQPKKLKWKLVCQ